MNIDIETDKYCGALLTEIANLNPQIAKQVTKKVSGRLVFRNDKKLRKAAKVAIIYKEHPDLFEAAAKALRRSPEYVSPESLPEVSRFYASVYRMYCIEPLPGSVESKYENRNG